MNKSSKQVEKFLTQYNFKSQTDFDMIASFCLQKYDLKINISGRFDTDYGLGVSEFQTWYDNGFAQGEIVQWEDKLAILYDSTLTECKINYYFNPGGELINIGIITINANEIRHASVEQCRKVVHWLLKNNLEINSLCLLVTKKYIPSNNKLIKFWNNDTIGFGVVRDISPEGIMTMFCYITLSGEIHYSMHDILGPIENYQFEEMTLGYRRKLERELNKHGKSWNDHRKRIEPINLRNKIGKNYFYITDLLKVAQTQDNGKATANFRYLCGNYFQSYEEALKCSIKWAEIRKNELAE